MQTPNSFSRLAGAALASMILVANTLPARAADGFGPSSVGELEELAVALCRRGECAQSVALYQKIAQVHPNDPDALDDLLWILWESGYLGEAAQVAKRLHELRKDDIHVLE